MHKIKIKIKRNMNPIGILDWENLCLMGRGTPVRTTTSPWRLKGPREQWASESVLHRYDQLVCQKASTSLLKPVQIQMPPANCNTKEIVSKKHYHLYQHRYRLIRQEEP